MRDRRPGYRIAWALCAERWRPECSFLTLVAIRARSGPRPTPPSDPRGARSIRDRGAHRSLGVVQSALQEFRAQSARARSSKLGGRSNSPQAVSPRPVDSDLLHARSADPWTATLRPNNTPAMPSFRRSRQTQASYHPHPRRSSDLAGLGSGSLDPRLSGRRLVGPSISAG